MGSASGQGSSSSDERSGTKYWYDYALRVLRTYVALVAEGNSESEMKDTLTLLKIASVRGTDSSPVAALFSSGLSSEAITNPHLRGAPFRKERLIKLGHAFRKARIPPGDAESLALCLPQNDIFLALNGQKEGNSSKLVNQLMAAS